jgi:hypothetical protein
VDITREQVLAYRASAHGLHRDARSVADLAVLDIGVQEAMGQPAAYAWRARLEEDVEVTVDSVAVGAGHRLALTWSLRGAPHVHRRGDLDALARALYPLSEQDAQARLNENGKSVERQGIAAAEQFATAVTAMRTVVTSPIDKGAASTAVSKQIPAAMLRDCRPCKAKHISDSAMRAATLAAGLEIEPGTSPPVLLRRKGGKVAKSVDRERLRELARAYLTLLGPANDSEFAGYIGARRADAATAWPDDLAEVSVQGRKAYLPGDCVRALGTAREPAFVRLLGPFDPYLQARDRALLVPDTAAHKVLWPVLGRPGALFVDGEIAGAWRTKAAGSKLTITVETFGAVRKTAWREIEHEAELVGQVRGAKAVTVKRLD